MKAPDSALSLSSPELANQPVSFSSRHFGHSQNAFRYDPRAWVGAERLDRTRLEGAVQNLASSASRRQNLNRITGVYFPRKKQQRQSA
jgi:hypothetical protein